MDNNKLDRIQFIGFIGVTLCFAFVAYKRVIQKENMEDKYKTPFVVAAIVSGALWTVPLFLNKKQ